MEIIIALVVIAILFVIFANKKKEPNIENLRSHQMAQYVKSLQNWIESHESIKDPSETIKTELKNKRALCDKAMTVWKRRIDEGNVQESQISAAEIKAQKTVLLMKKLRGLTLKLTHMRISMQEGNNAMPIESLQKLSDYEVSSLPENNIVTMAAIYRKLTGEGSTHEAALKVVNSTRVHPVQWQNVSKFQNIEGYIAERLKVELAAPSLSATALKYYTHDFISNTITETNMVFHEIFG